MSFDPHYGGWYRPINPNEHTYTEGYGFDPRPPFAIERNLIVRCSAAAVVCLLCSMILYSALDMMICQTLYQIFPHDIFPQLIDTISYFSQIFSYSLSMLIPFLLYAMFIKIPLWAAVPMKGVSPALITASVLSSLAVSVVGLFASDMVYFLFSSINVYFYDPITVLPNGIIATILYVINMTAVPAIFEEFAFRGVFMQSFRRFGDSFALITSSVLFALVHISPLSVPHAFLMGLVIGYFVLFTGSVHTGMIIHFIYNLLSLIISQLGVFDHNIGNLLFLVINTVFITVGLIAMIWLMKSYQNMFSLKNSNTVNRSGQKLRFFFCNIGFFLFMVIILFQAGAYLL